MGSDWVTAVAALTGVRQRLLWEELIGVVEDRSHKRIRLVN